MKRTMCVIMMLVSLLLPFQASADTNTEMLDACKAVLELALEPSESNEYSSKEIICDNSGFIIYDTIDGLFFGCLSYAMGLSDSAQWDSYVASTVDYAESIRTLIHEIATCYDDAGENLSLLYVVVDTTGHNIPYLVIYNGTVIYDCMPTWTWFCKSE